jgi:hypothetical protein
MSCHPAAPPHGGLGTTNRGVPPPAAEVRQEDTHTSATGFVRLEILTAGTQAPVSAQEAPRQAGSTARPPGRGPAPIGRQPQRRLPWWRWGGAAPPVRGCAHSDLYRLSPRLRSSPARVPRGQGAARARRPRVVRGRAAGRPGPSPQDDAASDRAGAGRAAVADLRPLREELRRHFSALHGIYESVRLGLPSLPASPTSNLRTPTSALAVHRIAHGADRSHRGRPRHGRRSRRPASSRCSSRRRSRSAMASRLS